MKLEYKTESQCSIFDTDLFDNKIIFCKISEANIDLLMIFYH